MQLERLTVKIFEDKELVHESTDAWGIFDGNQHEAFCPGESRRLRGTRSGNGRYTVGWAERERDNFDGQTNPPGVCLIRSNRVVLTIEIEGVYKAVIANNGTIVAIADRGDLLYVFDSQGEMLIQEEFQSNVSAPSISPDGEYAAVATAFPDNAVHLYRTRDGQYLGRTDNPGTSVIGYLRFSRQENAKILETYDIRPDSEMDVAPERKEVIDTIPVGPQMDTSVMEGLGLVPDTDESKLHYIPPGELKGAGTVRLPGVEILASCGQKMEPIGADLIYEDFQDAIQSDFDFCEGCQAESATYPQEKVERTFEDY